MIILIKKSGKNKEEKKSHIQLPFLLTICHTEIHLGPPLCCHGMEKTDGLTGSLVCTHLYAVAMQVLFPHWHLTPPLYLYAISTMQIDTPVSLWAHYRHLITEITDFILSTLPSRENPRLFLTASRS